MGASGTGIFDDDVACDIRAQFKRLLDEGKASDEATRVVLREWKEALADSDDGPVIWLALAATQARHGCLDAKVQVKALAVIDDGTDLVRWRETDDPALLRSRTAVLARLRDKLEAASTATVRPARPAKKPKKKRPPNDPRATFPIGELFGYRMTSGKIILLHVIDYYGNARVGWAPIVAVLDWRGKRIPPATDLLQIPYKKKRDLVTKHIYRVLLFSLGCGRPSELPEERIVHRVAERPAKSLKEINGWDGGFGCSRWRDLDADLVEWLGWK